MKTIQKVLAFLERKVAERIGKKYILRNTKDKHEKRLLLTIFPNQRVITMPNGRLSHVDSNLEKKYIEALELIEELENS